VKWLGRIVVAPAPSENYFQAKAYRVQRERNPDDHRDVSAGTALSEVPLNAVIVTPEPDAVVPAGRVRVQGWAMGAGGRAVTAVEISVDGGSRWSPARVVAGGSAWAWALWEATVELRSGGQTLVVRASDGADAAQPPALRDTWNVRGYNNNAWHRVQVRAR
jgi:sulfite oxidase